MRAASACAIGTVLAGGCQEYDLKGEPAVGVPTTTGSGTQTQTPTTPVGTTPTTSTTAGAPPRDEGEETDAIVVPQEFAVDVLWIIDNSGSMGDNQKALSAESPTFIDYFEATVGLDYHIGVVSTDMVDPAHTGKLQEAQGVRWIDADTADPYGVFAQMALMGTNGSGDEAGRAATQWALDVELNAWNKGFVRDEAPLAVIVISDEPDSSDLYGVGIQPFIDFMRQFKPDPALVTMSTVVGPVPYDTTGCAAPPTGYPDVQTALGGLFWSICDPNWDTVLGSLATLALGTRVEFFLTEIPVVDSIEVQIVEADGTETWLTELGVDFTYDGVRNSVTLLTYAPGPMATVYLHYEVDWGALP